MSTPAHVRLQILGIPLITRRPGFSSRNRPRRIRCDELVICAGCLRLKGRWFHRGDVDPYGLPCDCRTPRAEDSLPWCGLDFDQVLDLCRCCGAEVLSSGYRLAIWFCSECGALVGDLGRSGGALIPIGRHSVLHGMGLGPTDLDRADRLPTFASEARGLLETMKLLDVWAKRIVAQNCERLGFSLHDDVPLLPYLKGAASYSRVDAFLQLRTFFEERTNG